MANTISHLYISFNDDAQTEIVAAAGQESYSAPIDIITSYSARFFSTDSTYKAPFLNKVALSVVDSNGNTNVKDVYIGRELHKQMHYKGTLDNTNPKTAMATSTIKNFLGLPLGVLDISFWAPYIKSGGVWQDGALSVDDINFLGKIRGTFRVGLKLDYTTSQGTTARYTPVTGNPISWEQGTGTQPQARQAVCSGNTSTISGSIITLPTGPSTGMRWSAPNVLASILDTNIWSAFGLTWATITPSSTITLTPFLYVGEQITVGTTTPPSSLAYISISSTSYVTATRNVASGTALSTIAITNTDTNNNDGLTLGTDEFGWVAEYKSNGTEDTSISVGITIDQ